MRFTIATIVAVVGVTASPASAVELSRTDYNTAVAPIDPEIAGLDSQNGPDVVLGNGTPGVQVFLNDGSGRLGNPTDLPLSCGFGTTPQVELGALGFPDTVVDIVTGCLQAFRGNGDGTFGPAYSSGAGAREVLMDLGNINTATASVLDIASTCGSGGNFGLAYHEGNTDGTYGSYCVQHPTTLEYKRISTEVEIYNLGNDEFTDVLTFDQGRTQLVGFEFRDDLYPQTGYGPPATGSSRPTNSTNGAALETGDLDGDGDPDWVAAMTGPPSVLSVFEHLVNGFPAEAGGGKLVNTIEGVEDLELADVNRDGRLDAVTVSQYGVGVQLGNGDTTFKPVQTFSFVGDGGFGHNLATGDLNGDGLDDIVATTYTTADVSVFMSVPTDDTGPPPGTEPPGGTPPGTPPGGSPDATKPDLSSSTAKAKQKLGKPLKVSVTSDEDAALTATATAKPKGSAPKRAKTVKFKTVSAQAKAGTPITLKLKPSKKAARALKAATKAKAQITLSATDAAGNTATDSFKVKLT